LIQIQQGIKTEYRQSSLAVMKITAFYRPLQYVTSTERQVPVSTYVPETGTRFWYQKTGTRTWHQFLVPVARFLVPETNMAEDTDEIVAVRAMAIE